MSSQSKYLLNTLNPDTESKLSLIIRKPQEGKTGICISYITRDTSKNINIVITMNTLSAGMQFFGRLKEEIGCDKIIVFNSKKQVADGCLYAKTVADVQHLILNNKIKVIICCAHEKRIRESIPALLEWAQDSKQMSENNIQFKLHIDEAHKYIPENRDAIYDINNYFVVNSIYGYSASPDGIWSSNPRDPLFHKIHIRDVDAELEMIRSPHYFGVNCCEFVIYDYLLREELIERANIHPKIPPLTLKRANEEKEKEWYGLKSYFDLGDEILLLSFIDYILPILNILPNEFSYHFTPSYTRQVTHYECTELILKYYPTANVIVHNGNGFQMYRRHSILNKSELVKDDVMVKKSVSSILNKSERQKEDQALLEPSYMIQQLIKETANCPTFVTGFVSVGMSMTLINPTIGNFDNVVMAHSHYSKDKLYQLNRYLFNYDRWSLECRRKIKKTRFHSLTQSVVDKCLQYEEHVERLCTEFAGQTCTLREVQGLAPEELSERELKQLALDGVRLANPNGKTWKKFKVYDGNDDEVWEQVHAFYKQVRNVDLKGISKPKKNENGFYECTDSKGKGVKTTSTFTSFEKEKWTNRFQLQDGCYNYARVFVGYENLDDASEYTVFVKFAQLELTPENTEFLKKYGTSSSDGESSTVSAE